MKRGEIWTIAGGADYAGKPRPSVIVQSDAFDNTASLTVCGLTTDILYAPTIRVDVLPTQQNGLRFPSQLMIDKVTTVPRGKAGERVGTLDGDDLARLNNALLVFLGLDRGPRSPGSRSRG